MGQVFYIDPSRVVNGAGTYKDPYNTMPPNFQYAAYSTYLLKAGTTFIGPRQLNANNVTFGAYGSGDKPIWMTLGAAEAPITGSYGNSNCLIRDLKLIGLKRCINWGSGADLTIEVNNVIINCDFHVPLGGDPNIDNDAIMGNGRGWKVYCSTFNGIATDAMWFSSGNVEVAYCRVENVALDGRLAGDCLQFNGAVADEPGIWVHHNYFDHSSTRGKQCVMLNNGKGAIIEDNFCKHKDSHADLSNAIFVHGNDNIVRRNIVVGGRFGIWVDAGVNADVNNNLVINRDSIGGAIAITSAGGFDVHHNTVIGNGITPHGIRSYAASITTPATIHSNILTGFSSMALYKQTSTNITTNNNGFYDNANNEMGTQGANSIVLDPCFSDELLPQQYQFRIGGVDGVDTDLYGNPNNGCMGAIQPQHTEYTADKMPKYVSGGGLLIPSTL